ncbi:metallophosphoesterase family protein [Athalassotoga saccharophila]|uniref:metallophosphoesterase family protein n=1 Tax=Athalassotoga saccharophila TaxID=1441386 RepID=UPI00137ADBA0|nr:exonuclease SbcCD subunit D [Athalassotoga saccharophila]BBJ28031.1 exonuclease SbcD [Athalassotoga saccharophila]
MRILHCSDLHLGRKVSGSIYSDYFKERYQDFFKAFKYIADFAISKNVDVLMISGDIFDKKDLSPDTLEKAEEIFKSIKDAGIRTIAIEGNHDRIFDFENVSWLEYLKNKSYIVLLRPSVRNGEVFFDPWDGKKGGYFEIEDTRFYGVGYQGINFPEYIKALSELDDDHRNIMLIHTGIGDLKMPGFVSSKDFECIDGKFSYIAGGHLHSKSIQKIGKSSIFIPGSPEYWDIRESDQKGFFVYDTQRESVEFFESYRRKKIEKHLRLTQDSNLEENFMRLFSESAVEKGAMYLINIEIPFGVPLNSDLSEYESFVEKSGALNCTINLRQIENNQIDNESPMSIQEIENSIISKDKNFGSHSRSVTQAIDMLKSANDSDAFEILDKLFEDLVK